MAAAIPTCTEAGANTGSQGDLATLPGRGILEPGSAEVESTAGAANAAPVSSWSSFLEALGIAGDIAIELPAPGSPEPPAVSSNPRTEVPQHGGSSLADGASSRAPEKWPDPAGILPAAIAGSEKRSGRIADVKPESHHERKPKGSDNGNAPVQTVSVLGDVSGVATVPAPVPGLEPSAPVEKCSTGVDDPMGGASKHPHVPAEKPGDGIGIHEAFVPAGTLHFESESRSMDARLSEASLVKTDASEPHPGAGTDQKAEMPLPIQEKETTALAPTPRLVDIADTKSETNQCQHVLAGKADPVPAAPANNSPKSARPSSTIPDHGSRTARLDLSGDFFNQGRPPDAVQQPWDRVAPPHISGGLTGVDDRSGNNLSAVHPVQSTTSDTFAALDAERMGSPATWIHAGTHHAEAGYLDPALGWVGVRADAAGNGVHATVLPGSGEAAQVLGSHLAGLNSYLSEHHGQSTTVTLAGSQDSLPLTGSGTGAHGEQDHTAHHENQNTNQDTNQGRDEWQGRQIVHGSSPSMRVGLNSQGALRAGIPARAGKYISVMA
jgi:hypothetical protein